MLRKQQDDCLTFQIPHARAEFLWWRPREAHASGGRPLQASRLVVREGRHLWPIIRRFP